MKGYFTFVVVFVLVSIILVLLLSIDSTTTADYSYSVLSEKAHRTSMNIKNTMLDYGLLLANKTYRDYNQQHCCSSCYQCETYQSVCEATCEAKEAVGLVTDIPSCVLKCLSSYGVPNDCHVGTAFCQKCYNQETIKNLAINSMCTSLSLNSTGKLNEFDYSLFSGGTPLATSCPLGFGFVLKEEMPGCAKQVVNGLKLNKKFCVKLGDERFNFTMFSCFPSSYVRGG